MESWCVRRPDRPSQRRGQSSVHPQGERTPRPLDLEHMRTAWANSDAFTTPEQVLLQDPEFVAGLAPGHGRLPSQMEELPQQQQ